MNISYNYIKIVAVCLATCALIACADTAKITPKPDIRPAQISNTQTRKSIGESQHHSRRTQTILKEQGHHLDIATDDLQSLLK